MLELDRFYNCPSCHADLKREWQDSDGSVVVGSDIIGWEIRGFYDGVVYWQCPICNVVWHRFAESPGNNALRYKVETYWAEKGLTQCRDTL